ncbi:MAG: MATE family efflux transporter [Phycisphaerae bacterium]
MARPNIEGLLSAVTAGLDKRVCANTVREVMAVALPLILSTSVHSVRTFTDRAFLMHYDPNAMSAAMFAGLAHFTFIAFFVGLVSYVSTFVAQYYGAGRSNRIGPSIWQGIFIAIVSGLLVSGVFFLAEPLFKLVAHGAETTAYEITYFKILCSSYVLILVNSTLSCFYVGRGMTRIVLCVNTISCVSNVLLDYILIFGHFGFPRLGITGAAIATVSSVVVSSILYILFFFNRKNDEQFHTLRGFGFDKELILRVLRFGSPNGVNFLLDMMAFTSFLAFVGRFGDSVQTAISLVFSINMMAFMPVVGLGMAVNTLTGKYLGAGRPDKAVHTAFVSYALALSYFFLTSLVYVFAGNELIRFFGGGITSADYDEIARISYPFLCWIAVYALGDAGLIVFSNVLKGAGDTRFVLLSSVSFSWLLMVLPAYLAARFGGSYHIPWIGFSTYIYLLNFIFLARFLKGKWKKMRVIEDEAVEELVERVKLPLQNV